VQTLSLAEQRRLIYHGLLKIWLNKGAIGEPVSYQAVAMVLDMVKKKRHLGLDLPGGLRGAVNKGEISLSLALRLAGHVGREDFENSKAP
ncbi:MAG: hypothetical protein ACRCTY_02865, partial [Candidatus Adiutrix sp.]